MYTCAIKYSVYMDTRQEAMIATVMSTAAVLHERNSVQWIRRNVMRTFWVAFAAGCSELQRVGLATAVATWRLNTRLNTQLQRRQARTAHSA